MRLVGCDTLFFWTKTTTFPWSGNAAAQREEGTRSANLPPGLARGAALRKPSDGYHPGELRGCSGCWKGGATHPCPEPALALGLVRL